MLVSVITPAYNVEKYISQAIESIIKQTYKNFEYIIFDDCSNDNTWEIIQEYAKKDNRIKAFRNDINKNSAETKNIAISYCNGDYIAIMDADDTCDPTRLEKQLKYLTENKIDICGTNLIYFDESGELGRKKYINVNDTILIESPICHASTIIKRELFNRYGNYSQEYEVAQDYDLWLKFYSKGAKFGIVPEYLYKYRQHPQMAKASKTKLTLKNTIKIKINAMKNYGIKFGFRGWLRLIAEMILFLLPGWLILKLFYLKNK